VRPRFDVRATLGASGEQHHIRHELGARVIGGRDDESEAELSVTSPAKTRSRPAGPEHSGRRLPAPLPLRRFRTRQRPSRTRGGKMGVCSPSRPRVDDELPTGTLEAKARGHQVSPPHLVEESTTQCSSVGATFQRGRRPALSRSTSAARARATSSTWVVSVKRAAHGRRYPEAVSAPDPLTPGSSACPDTLRSPVERGYHGQQGHPHR
jgi:hypothetical protein